MKTRDEIIQETNWFEVARTAYYGYKHGDMDALEVLENYAEVLEEYECCCCTDPARQHEELKWIPEYGHGGVFYCDECAEAEGVIE